MLELINEQVLCRLRLCRADKLIHDGKVTWKEPKKNLPGPRKDQPRHAYMEIYACKYCGRQIRRFWDDKKIEEYKKSA